MDLSLEPRVRTAFGALVVLGIAPNKCQDYAFIVLHLFGLMKDFLRNTAEPSEGLEVYDAYLKKNRRIWIHLSVFGEDGDAVRYERVRLLFITQTLCISI